MSNWQCPVVEIPEIQKHPNADKLGIVEVEGTKCIVSLADWKQGDKAVLIPIDSVVPLDRPEFAFLLKGNMGKTPGRIKAVLLRGIFSDGILVPAPKGSKLGSDASDLLGITKFEEEEPIEPQPKGWFQLFRRWISTKIFFFLRKLGIVKGNRPKRKSGRQVFVLSNKSPRPIYGLDKYAKYKNILQTQEIIATEKLHGSNHFICNDKGKIYVGSHYTTGGTEVETVYVAVAKKYGLIEKMAKLPGFALYGEVLGVQDLRYGFTKEDPGYAAFDLYDIANRRYLDWDEFEAKCKELDIPIVPVVYEGSYLPSIIEEEVNGTPKKPKMSLLHPETLREGLVIKNRRTSLENLRVALKFVSESYLLRKNGTEHH